MFLIDHIKYSSIPSLILVPLVGIKVLYFFLASILIDLDHYPMSIIATKSFSIKRMFRYHQELFKYVKKNPYLGLCIFHTMEFLAIFIVLSFYSSIAFYILLGLIYHLVLDTIFLYKEGCLFKKANSILEYFVRRNNYKTNILKVNL